MHLCNIYLYQSAKVQNLDIHPHLTPVK